MRDGFKLVVCDDADSASEVVSNEIGLLIREKPEAVLGLATGGTPVATYEKLAESHRLGECDFSKTVTFNLDEYLGLAPTHSQSFRFFMERQLFDHINVAPANTHVPNGLTDDVAAECQRYENLIRDHGGIEMQLLGLGHNGHIAFNEPGSPKESRTRQVDLTGETIENNARFFDSIGDVPRHALTMGIGTILESKRIILLATGDGKRDAVQKMVRGPMTSDHPASFLQTHPDVMIVLDREAAGDLK